MQIYRNKRKRLHNKKVQLPEDWFGTPTWPLFYCFGAPIWPPWRHVKTLYNIQSSLRGRRLKGKGKGGRLHSKIRPNWTLLSHPTPHSDSFQIINWSGDGKDHAIASWWCKESDKAEVEKTRHCEKMESAVNFPYSILSTSNVRRFFWGIYLNAETKSLHLSSTHLHLSQNYLTERNRKDRLRIPQLTQQTQYLFPPFNWQFSYTANLQFSVRLFHCNFLSGFDT